MHINLNTCIHSSNSHTLLSSRVEGSPGSPSPVAGSSFWAFLMTCIGGCPGSPGIAGSSFWTSLATSRRVPRHIWVIFEIHGALVFVAAARIRLPSTAARIHLPSTAARIRKPSFVSCSFDFHFVYWQQLPNTQILKANIIEILLGDPLVWMMLDGSGCTVLDACRWNVFVFTFFLFYFCILFFYCSSCSSSSSGCCDLQTHRRN